MDIPCVEVAVQEEQSEPLTFLSSVHAGVWGELEAVDGHFVVGVVNQLEQKMHTKISFKNI
jgi:hypothetical protein